MKKAIILAAMAAALTAAAEMKFGTVNMVDLVRLHPDHEKNRTLLKTTDSEYKAKLDAKQDDLKEIADEGKKVQEDLQNPMLSSSARADAQKKLAEIDGDARRAAASAQARNDVNAASYAPTPGVTVASEPIAPVTAPSASGFIDKDFSGYGDAATGFEFDID